ncbi:oxidoreductase, zinc-binding dehydrogenase family protein [Plesiocystis pacifica SIR-1]|uniref:Oxidoreductase, zinc-binding dehydrogenase family protein n=1 Tax=Plesiocystis pacifica SIR-1 TaxID=391625 RepID=A6G293_9BACT|nr:NADPH:quinone oxidoreductase family protein [Plesiocystis pacifica]EDM80062.1 oxidoreductase, zinc-binding dehydrogenase family protein [Plesiocystis pacifica SIR-1]
MRAAHVTALEGPDALEVVELPDPEPSRGQVVVAVESAGVNFPDLLLTRGLYQLRPNLPFAPGGEVAGEVVAVGEGAGFEVGERVMALTGWNGFATHVVLGAERCVRVPETMPTDLAGAFAFTYGTTYHGLVDRGGLAKGERLLVLGAAGGVGSAAVELGVALGARVIAAASSPEKLAFCAELGAEAGIDYAQEDLKKRAKALGGGAVDVVYDPVGGERSEQALRALGPGGRHLVIGFASGTIPRVAWNLALLKQCAIVGVSWGAWALMNPKANAENMRALFELHAAGKLRPQITARYGLEQVGEALRAMEARAVKGKVIIEPQR